MFTNQRLMNAYMNAKKIPFDEDSKFVFFSDCHRGDDSISDEFARNQTVMLSALSYYYDNGFTYIETGDGDDLWEHGDFKYIRSAHSDIFTILKEFYEKDRLIMLYGNHNIALKKERFVKKNYYYYFDEYKNKYKRMFYGLKPKEAIVLKEKNTGQEILALHGHQGDFFNDQFWFLSMIAVRFFWRFMHLVGFHNPASPARNQFSSHKIERKYRKWLQNHPVILICGHTHRFRFAKKGSTPYFNIGCCVHTKGISAIELTKNNLSLVQWRVAAHDNGVLNVIRKEIYKPEPIAIWRK